MFREQSNVINTNNDNKKVMAAGQDTASLWPL